MICSKCGAVLDDDAVFCDKCGSFEMREEVSDHAEPVVIEKAGKRRRRKSTGWFLFKTFAWVLIAAAGIAAIILGYRLIDGERMYFNKSPLVSDQLVWGESWMPVQLLPPY